MSLGSHMVLSTGIQSFSVISTLNFLFILIDLFTSLLTKFFSLAVVFPRFREMSFVLFPSYRFRMPVPCLLKTNLRLDLWKQMETRKDFVSMLPIFTWDFTGFGYSYFPASLSLLHSCLLCTVVTKPSTFRSLFIIKGTVYCPSIFDSRTPKPLLSRHPTKFDI